MDARATFPLTTRHLGDRVPVPSSAAEYAKAVRERFALGDIPCRAVRDLVRFEEMLAELEPAPTAGNGPLPADDELCVLAPHARVLMFGAALDEMLEALRIGKPAKARPRRGWVVLWRDAGGKLHEHNFPREGGWMLEQLREPAKPEDILVDEARPLFAGLWREGVIVRA